MGRTFAGCGPAAKPDSAILALRQIIEFLGTYSAAELRTGAAKDNRVEPALPILVYLMWFGG